MDTHFYDFSVKSSDGKEIKMSDFKGKAVLIVNTATQCGLANQFKGLEALHQKFKEKGLVILGFPCAQFLNQEPESNENMKQVCEINFGVSFPLTEKIEVNGQHTHPIFVYLKDNLSGLFGKKITWNFTKFLLTPEGIPYKRFAPVTKPENIEGFIKQLLPKKD